MLSIDSLVAISLAAKFLALLSGTAKIAPAEKLYLVLLSSVSLTENKFKRNKYS